MATEMASESIRDKLVNLLNRGANHDTFVKDIQWLVLVKIIDKLSLSNSLDTYSKRHNISMGCCTPKCRESGTEWKD